MCQCYMDNFCQTHEECGVEDVGFEGDRFTCQNNSHTMEGYIQERLDRAVANSEWQELFSNVRVINDDTRHLDHRHLLVDMGLLVERRNLGRGAGFRFEVAWVEEEGCKAVVKEAWERLGGRSQTPMFETLVSVANDLARWGANVLGELDQRIKGLKKELKQCRRGSLSSEQIARGVLR